MDVKGILIDFGNTLAYLDEDGDRRYREGIATVLKSHGYKKTLDDLSPIIDDAYKKSSQGEVKGIYEFWRLLLCDLGIPENLEIIKELTEHRGKKIVAWVRPLHNLCMLWSL